MSASRRKISKRAESSPGIAPLRRAFLAAGEASAHRWTEVEAPFLRAMWEFDENAARGIADQGDIQNGKGGFLAGLIALLLENATGRLLHTRRGVPGRCFPQHRLAASYPAEGPVKLVVEAKVAGAPKTGRNPRELHAKGRPGSRDLRRRITPVGLKSIDLKAEAIRQDGEEGRPAGELSTWLRSTRPRCFLFLAIRVVDARDLRRTIQLADTAKDMLDGLGLIAYEEAAGQTGYVPLAVPQHLELDRVLARATTTLRDFPG